MKLSQTFLGIYIFQFLEYCEWKIENLTLREESMWILNHSVLYIYNRKQIKSLNVNILTVSEDNRPFILVT
jgi:hypothetical protein